MLVKLLHTWRKGVFIDKGFPPAEGCEEEADRESPNIFQRIDFIPI
jgi:hypothetical protein